MWQAFWPLSSSPCPWHSLPSSASQGFGCLSGDQAPGESPQAGLERNYQPETTREPLKSEDRRGERAETPTEGCAAVLSRESLTGPMHQNNGGRAARHFHGALGSTLDFWPEGDALGKGSSPGKINQDAVSTGR